MNTHGASEKGVKISQLKQLFASNTLKNHELFFLSGNQRPYKLIQ